jgi:hypothetical protein
VYTGPTYWLVAAVLHTCTLQICTIDIDCVPVMSCWMHTCDMKKLKNIIVRHLFIEYPQWNTCSWTTWTTPLEYRQLLYTGNFDRTFHCCDFRRTSRTSRTSSRTSPSRDFLDFQQDFQRDFLWTILVFTAVVAVFQLFHCCIINFCAVLITVYGYFRHHDEPHYYVDCRV